MKYNVLAQFPATTEAIESVRRLADQLARAPARSPLHRRLRAALHTAAVAYRHALDAEQTAALHDTKRIRPSGQSPTRVSSLRDNVATPPDRHRRQRSASRRPRSSWLFIRDAESIRMERAASFRVEVAGPGTARAHRQFPNEKAVAAFQADTAARLTRGGWLRVTSNPERRVRDDRRGRVRATADRRLPLVAGKIAVRP